MVIGLLASAAVGVSAAEDAAADASVGIIGGADGPTAILVTQTMAQEGSNAEAAPLSFDHIAEALYSVGILRGDGANFNLGDTPDRLQACVMVVRMRGEEAAALAAYEAGEITCPFTDVGDDAAWAKPYLAWLYEKKITLGVGDGKFGNTDCTAQMYTTFMLRALGYADVVAEGAVADFSFDDALTFAQSVSLWDSALAAEPFTRGTMAAVTYQTLAADVKGAGADAEAPMSLLASLSANGAVPADAADVILSRFANAETAKALYDTYLAKQNDQKTAMSMIWSVSAASADSNGAETATKMFMEMQMAQETKENLVTAAAMTGAVTMNTGGVDISIPFGMWIDGQTVYTEMLGEKTYSAYSAPSQDIGNTAEVGALVGADDATSAMIENTIAGLMPYYAYSDITITAENDLTYVTYDITDLVQNALLTTAAAEFSEEPIFDMVPSAMACLAYDKQGMLTDIFFGMYVYAAFGTQDAIVSAHEYSLDMTVTDMLHGDDVVISYPDFSAFVPAGQNA